MCGKAALKVRAGVAVLAVYTTTVIARFYETRLNESYRELAEYYGNYPQSAISDLDEILNS